MKSIVRAHQQLNDGRRPRIGLWTSLIKSIVGLALVAALFFFDHLVRGGWRVGAQSKGKSLVLLPVQFSGCLALNELQDLSGRVIALRRANLASAALIFEGIST